MVDFDSQQDDQQKDESHDQMYSGYMATYQGDYSPKAAQYYKPPKPTLQESQAEKNLGLTVGESQQDLNLQIRSEFGFDGAESYFEAYPNEVKFILSNIFFNFNHYSIFLLGSDSQAGILGSSTLGSTLDSSLRQVELNSVQDFSEDFTTTTYKDGSTTANWTTVGSLSFVSGSLAVVANWKSGSYQLTYFDRIRVDIDYKTFGSGLTFEASFNGGSNYTTIFPSIEYSGSPVGSDFRLKITDPTGSSVITKIYFITKGQNFPASS